jgi:hypothetical protein
MPDETPDHNKIKLFRAEGAYIERRHSPLPQVHTILTEKPLDLIAFWKVIRRRRWTVLTAFSGLFLIVLAPDLT